MFEKNMFLSLALISRAVFIVYRNSKIKIRIETIFLNYNLDYRW